MLNPILSTELSQTKPKPKLRGPPKKDNNKTDANGINICVITRIICNIYTYTHTRIQGPNSPQLRLIYYARVLVTYLHLQLLTYLLAQDSTERGSNIDIECLIQVYVIFVVY